MITEKEYPIQWRWVVKEIIGNILKGVIFLTMAGFFLWAEADQNFSSQQLQLSESIIGHYGVYIIILTLISAIISPLLRRATFSYAFEDDYITVRQGIIAREERHIPYNVIQNIIISRNLDDLIFGLSNLKIENAAAGGGYIPARKPNQSTMLGSSSNHLQLTGLQPADVTVLKKALLAKMLAHSDRTDSGL